MITTGANECESKNAINNYCFKTIFSFAFVVIFSDCCEQFSLACTFFFPEQGTWYTLGNFSFVLHHLCVHDRGWKLNNLTSVIHYSLGVFLPIIHYSDMTVLFIIPDSPNPNIHYSFSVHFFYSLSIIQLPTPTQCSFRGWKLEAIVSWGITAWFAIGKQNVKAKEVNFRSLKTWFSQSEAKEQHFIFRCFALFFLFGPWLVDFIQQVIRNDNQKYGCVRRLVDTPVRTNWHGRI